VLTLSGFGVFPVSAALAGVAVGAFGPAPFFVFAGLTTGLPVLFGLTQQTWRDYGATLSPAAPPAPRAAAAPPR
jgi:hypothetical protein